MRVLQDVIDDKRYHNQRWRTTAKRVLARDGYRCWAMQQQPDETLIACPVRASVADHIVPSSLTMPDHEFYSMANLRASCRRHNTARGVAARLMRETAHVMAPTPDRGDGRLRPSSAFFRGSRGNDRPLAKNTYRGALSVRISKET